MEQEFRKIADHAQVPRREQSHVNIFELVADWLSEQRNRRGLLIMDNFDDTSSLSYTTRLVEEAAELLEIVDHY